MKEFGVRFAVHDKMRFDALRALFGELEQDKDAGWFRDLAEWVRLIRLCPA
jgi:hypothetical protein